MKKVILLCLSLFLLVGCGIQKTADNGNATKGNGSIPDNKKESVLICNIDTKNTIDFNTEMTFYFDNDKAVKLGVKYTYDLSSYTDQQREVFATAKMCDNTSVTDSLGMVDCKEELVGTNYIVTGYAQKLLSRAIGTLSDMKKAYTNEGWKCISK